MFEYLDACAWLFLLSLWAGAVLSVRLTWLENRYLARRCDVYWDKLQQAHDEIERLRNLLPEEQRK